MYKIKVIDNINEVTKTEWDSVIAKNNLFFTYDYLKAVEKSKIQNFQLKYLLVYSNEELIGNTCIYLTSYPLDAFLDGIVKKMFVFIRKTFNFRFLYINTLECGGAISLGNPFSFNVNKNEQHHLLKLILNQVEEIFINCKASLIIIRDFFESEIEHLLLTFEKFGYIKMKSFPLAVMNIRWNSFDEYVNSLRSHYRHKLKKNINKMRDGDIKIEVKENLIKDAQLLLQLWLNIYNSTNEIQRELINREYFININKYLNKKVKIISAIKENDIVGFLLVFFDDYTLRFLYSGLDYKYNKKYSIYFNLLYNLVRIGIEERAKEIDLGISTYIPKIELGSELKPFYLFIKNKYSFFNRFIPRLEREIDKSIKFKGRRIFNKIYEIY